MEELETEQKIVDFLIRNRIGNMISDDRTLSGNMRELTFKFTIPLVKD